MYMYMLCPSNATHTHSNPEGTDVPFLGAFEECAVVAPRLDELDARRDELEDRTRLHAMLQPHHVCIIPVHVSLPLLMLPSPSGSRSNSASLPSLPLCIEILLLSVPCGLSSLSP